ncbi:MAG: hypothetical protein ABW186_00610 [Rhodanobacteraceae bacterium]
MAPAAAPGNNLNAMAKMFDSTVAVGDGGVILRSTSDTQWGIASSNTRANLNAVSFCAGMLVAVGNGGAAVYSTDRGATWTPADTGTTENFSGIVCGPSGFLALTLFTVVTSTDGQHWSPVSTGVVTGTDPFSDSTYSGVTASPGIGYTIEVTNAPFGPTPGVSMLNSADGAAWILTPVMRPDDWTSADVLFRAMAWGNGRFVAVNRDVVLTSTDAVSWDWNVPGSYLGNIVYVLPHSLDYDAPGARFIGIGDLNDPANSGTVQSIVATTPDGVSWTNTLVDAPGLRGVHALDFNQVYARGLQGSIYREQPDGSFAAVAGGSPATMLASIAIDGDVAIAVGATLSGTALLRSGDRGATWQTVDGVNVGAGVLSRVARIDGRWIAVGTAAGAPQQGLLFTSTDGVAWTQATLDADIRALDGIAQSDDAIILSGQAGDVSSAFVLRSTDGGASWVRTPVAVDAELSQVVSNGTAFFAVASPTTQSVYVSPDGVNWSAQTATTDPSSTALQLASQGSRVLALIGSTSACGGCASGPIGVASPNGDGTWSSAPIPANMSRLGSTGDGFFLAGTQGTVAFSADGTAWQASADDPSLSLVHAIAARGDGSFLAVTSTGHVLSYEQGAADRLFANGFDDASR